jgi:hypothetical protein
MGSFIITDKIHFDLPLNDAVQSERNRQRTKNQKEVKDHMALKNVVDTFSNQK